MEKIKINYKDLIIFAIYISITFFIFFKKISLSVDFYGMSGVDTDGSFWYYWMKNFADVNLINFNLNNFLTYPFGYDLYYIPFSNIHGVGGIVPFLIKFFDISTSNLAFLSNLSIFLSYPVVAIITYFLSLHLTKNRFAAFCSGTIFAFSYFFILMGRGSLSHNHIEFIPLFFLFLFLYLDTKKNYLFLLSVLSFALLLHINAYWAFFCGIFSIFILFFYVISGRFKLIEVTKFYFVLLIITSLLNFNFIMQNIYTLNSELLKLAGKTFVVEKQLSNALALFSPSKESFLYGNFIDYNNRGIFLGYMAVIISFLGLFFNRKNKLYLLFFICFLFSILLMSFIPAFSPINELYFKFF